MNTAISSKSVGQLDKTRCPTDNALTVKDLAVGRHQNHFHVRAREALKRKITDKQFQGSPKSLRAFHALTDVRRFIRFVHKAQPKVNVYFGHHRRILPEVHETLCDLQYNLFKDLVKTFAVLHQRYRDQYKDGILADMHDYLCALRVMKYKAPKKRIKVLYQGRNKLLDFLQTNYKNRVFSTKSLAIDTGYSANYLKELLKQLAREGLIQGSRDKRNQHIKYRLVNTQ